MSKGKLPEYWRNKVSKENFYLADKGLIQNLFLKQPCKYIIFNHYFKISDSYLLTFSAKMSEQYLLFRIVLRDFERFNPDFLFIIFIQMFKYDWWLWKKNEWELID